MLKFPLYKILFKFDLLEHVYTKNLNGILPGSWSLIGFSGENDNLFIATQGEDDIRIRYVFES